MKPFVIALVLVSAFAISSVSPALANRNCGLRIPTPIGCDGNSARCVCLVDKNGNKTCGWIFDC